MSREIPKFGSFDPQDLNRVVSSRANADNQGARIRGSHLTKQGSLSGFNGAVDSFVRAMHSPVGKLHAGETNNVASVDTFDFRNALSQSSRGLAA